MTDPSGWASADDDTLGAAVAEVARTRDTTADVGPSVPPQQLIFSIFLLRRREDDGWLSSAAVVRLAGALGIDEPLARAAVSRMKRGGYLQSVKRDRVAGYQLTPGSVRVAIDGDKRIYGRGRALPDDSWVLIGFSVPESQREKRHQIRTALIRLGFGTVSPGMWIAPAHLGGEAQATLHQLGVTELVDVFRASYLAFGDLREKVASWWDLDAMTTMYTGFVDRFAHLAGQPDAAITPESAFAGFIPMISTWRRMPYLDPGLPLSFLPPGWAGSEAEALFTRLEHLLRGPAEAFAAADV